MEIFVQDMVGGNVIVTFDRVDVELTREDAEHLEVLLVKALERSTRDPLLMVAPRTHINSLR